jgi:hypothetical protein
LKRKQRLARKRSASGPASLHGKHWATLNENRKKEKYRQTLLKLHHQKRNFTQQLKRYKKYEIFLSEQQSQECADVLKIINGRFQDDVSDVLRYV